MAILKVANIHFDAAGTTVIRANGANTLTFNTAGTEDARIDASGNVLIGRINSTVGNNVKLDVAGGVNASVILINGSSIVATLDGANVITNAAFTQANTARTHANTAHETANAAIVQANTARNHANAAFEKANSTTYSSNVVISVADNTNAALRITQTGTGESFRVEDSANPDASPFVIDATGNVLVGRTNSTVGLNVLVDVNGAINCSNILVNGSAVSGGGSITVTDQSSVTPVQYLTFTTTTSGTASSLNVATTKLTFNVATGTLSSTIFNSTSDINKKTNIQIIDNSLEILDALSGYRFNWKDNGLPSLGVIAQEVETVLPELIGEDNSVNYNGIIAVLIQAVKELKAEIEVLKSK